MAGDNIKDLSERTAIIEEGNDKAFVYAYVELREAARYAQKHFKSCSIEHGITDFFHRQVPRYARLPRDLKEEAKEYAKIYPGFKDRDIKRTAGLQSPDNQVFIRAFEELTTDAMFIRNGFSHSAFWKGLEKRREVYQKRYNSL